MTKSSSAGSESAVLSETISEFCGKFSWLAVLLGGAGKRSQNPELNPFFALKCEMLRVTCAEIDCVLSCCYERYHTSMRNERLQASLCGLWKVESKVRQFRTSGTCH